MNAPTWAAILITPISSSMEACMREDARINKVRAAKLLLWCGGREHNGVRALDVCARRDWCVRSGRHASVTYPNETMTGIA